MLSHHDLMVFSIAALASALTPGPNAVYCVSRALSQGRVAGLVSLAGVQLGFLVHLSVAALGLSAVLANLPFAFDGIRMAGTTYLLWMAWHTIRPIDITPVMAPTIALDRPGRLLGMGFVTNLLNPRVLMFYLSIFPTFLRPGHGSVLSQSLQLGAIQIGLSGLVNCALVLGAARLCSLASRGPRWMLMQRCFMASVLAALALQTALSAHA